MTELCLIEVPWEKRNLGMPAYQLEGTIENHTIAEAILEKKRKELKENFFVQLKIDAEKIDEVKFSQEAGFKFAEMSICPYLDLGIVKSNIASDGAKSQYSLESSNNLIVENHCSSIEDLDSLIKNEIINISQETFSTDRFHMDSSCKKAIADVRIGLWLELDIFKENKNSCTYLKIDKNLIGFMIWNQGGFILGGLSKNFIGKGFGKTLYIQAILDAMNAGLKEISTNISVNNLPVLNLYSKLGFSFRSPKYTLHYWS
jgi:hypothetical protein